MKTFFLRQGSVLNDLRLDKEDQDFYLSRRSQSV